jgi:putative transposase
VDERLQKAAYPGLLQYHPHAHEALEYATMNDATTNDDALPLASQKDVLTAVLHHGATRMLAQAIEAEIDAYLHAHSQLRDEAGRQLLVRNGFLPQRTILTGIGAVEVKQPRVKDRRPAEQREKFSSSILPPYLRKTKSIEELIPWLYLKGISTGDFSEALAAILGPQAKGLSAATVTRLKAVWADEYDAWSNRPVLGGPFPRSRNRLR